MKTWIGGAVLLACVTMANAAAPPPLQDLDATIERVRAVKAQIEATRTELEKATRAGQYEKAGELQYGRIPELEKQIAAAQATEQKGFTLLKNKVSADEIAALLVDPRPWL